MSRASIRDFGVVFVLATVGLGTASATGPRTAGTEDATPTGVFRDPPEGVSIETVTRGSTDDVLAVARVVAVSRVTLSPDAGQLTDTETPAIFYVESGPVNFHVDEDMTTPAMLIRASVEGPSATPVVVIPGTSLDLQSGDLLATPGRADDEPPYPYIGISNNTEGPVSYIDIEIFPSENRHFSGSAGNPEIQPLDVSLGLQTAQEATPDVVSVGRLTVESGASLPLADVGPTLFIVQDGTMSLATDEGEVAVKRSETPFDEAPEYVAAGSSDDLAEGDSAFVMPGTAGSIRNGGARPLVVLTVSVVPTVATVAGTPTA